MRTLAEQEKLQKTIYLYQNRKWFSTLLKELAGMCVCARVKERSLWCVAGVARSVRACVRVADCVCGGMGVGGFPYCTPP